MENSQRNSKQTLWVVSELYYPEMTSTGYYLTAIAEGLTDKFEVKVLCGQPNYSGRGTVAPKHEIYKDVEIFRAFGTTLDKNVIIFRLINMLTLSFSVFWKALFNFRRGDKILVVTTPPSMPFIVALASLIRGGSYVLLIHDNYPEILDCGRENYGKFVFGKNNRIFQPMALQICQSKIIVCGRDMRELVERKTRWTRYSDFIHSELGGTRTGCACAA